jgi:hypothetical protein
MCVTHIAVGISIYVTTVTTVRLDEDGDSASSSFLLVKKKIITAAPRRSIHHEHDASSSNTLQVSAFVNSCNICNLLVAVIASKTACLEICCRRSCLIGKFTFDDGRRTTKATLPADERRARIHSQTSYGTASIDGSKSIVQQSTVLFRLVSSTCGTIQHYLQGRRLSPQYSLSVN